MNFNLILFFIIVILCVFILLEKIYIRFFRNILTKENSILIKHSKNILPVFLIVFFLRVFFFEPYMIPTGSMRPTLLEGDFIFVNKNLYGIKLPFFKKIVNVLNKPKRGDVVVFKHFSGDNYVKRIIGVPGDHIEYKNSFIYVNGMPVYFKYCNKNVVNTKDSIYIFKEKFLDFSYYVYKDLISKNSSYIYNDVIVPINCYFVLGDNRDNSNDSRYWGFVNYNFIIGKVYCIWLSVDLENFNVRYKRFFNII